MTRDAQDSQSKEAQKRRVAPAIRGDWPPKATGCGVNARATVLHSGGIPQAATAWTDKDGERVPPAQYGGALEGK